MILTYLNQTVEIKIPKTTKRLKQNIIDDMFNEYGSELYFNKELLDRLLYDKCSPENIEEIPIKNIGMWMSGGADSSLLAYLLCKKIKDEKLDVKFNPISVRRGRPWNPIYAQSVMDFIIDDLNFKNMNDHIIYYPDINDEMYREISIFWEKDTYHFQKNYFEIVYSGLTSNPPENSGVSRNKERNRDEDVEKPIETWSCLKHFMNPFFNINKKWEAEVYKDLGLMDTLFPLTRSCEGADYQSGNFTYHCGRCWWCEERMWAFGRLQ